MIPARELLASWSAELGVAPELIDAAFGDAPLDFLVHFRAHLPLKADRSGASGITLFGKVYLLDRVRSWSPLERILILRHEAEHVRQQRADPLFYPRYGIGWLAALIRSDRGASWRSRAGEAYRSIATERDAYAAERLARSILAPFS